jgi:hypothetical protein
VAVAVATEMVEQVVAAVVDIGLLFLEKVLEEIL